MCAVQLCYLEFLMPVFAKSARPSWRPCDYWRVKSRYQD